MELSFVDIDDVIDVNERLLQAMFKEILGVDIPLPMPRMTWQEAMDRFGSDKPDTPVSYTHLVNKLLDEYEKEHKVEVTDDDVLKDTNNNKANVPRKSNSKSGIIVEGMDDVAVRFSKCCSPVPGDEIVGFVTRGRGVSIHRTDCINIMNLPDIERGRLIEASWAADEGKQDGKYMTEIVIYANNRVGILTDLSRIFTERNIDVNSINSRTSKSDIATITMTFAIQGTEELNSLIAKIRTIDSIIDIERTSS